MLRIGLCRAAYIALSRAPGVFSSSPSQTVRLLHVTARCRFAEQQPRDSTEFDPQVLQYLVCPLSRKPLRYEEATKELINDELGIAYPIVDGIPNMTPQDARMIQKDQKPKETEESS
ncbi:protein preY, mitochondrial [Pelodytes ibericus]